MALLLNSMTASSNCCSCSFRIPSTLSRCMAISSAGEGCMVSTMLRQIRKSLLLLTDVDCWMQWLPIASLLKICCASIPSIAILMFLVTEDLLNDKVIAPMLSGVISVSHNNVRWYSVWPYGSSLLL